MLPMSRAEELPPAAAVTPDACLQQQRQQQQTASCRVPEPLVASSITELTFLNTAKPIRPTPEECWYVMTELGKLHPEVIQRESAKVNRTPLGLAPWTKRSCDGVVGTILSQNTTSANSSPGLCRPQGEISPRGSKSRRLLMHPNWRQVIPDRQGLAKTKSERIYAMLKDNQEGTWGQCRWSTLRDVFPTTSVKADLSRFKGMGPKTISCVMLFAMRRSEFPVDTHVHRICQQLGWTGRQATSREASYYHLNATVPSE
jgi:endonuclease-3